jgi:hypothetical protein
MCAMVILATRLTQLEMQIENNKLHKENAIRKGVVLTVNCNSIEQITLGYTLVVFISHSGTRLDVKLNGVRKWVG